MLFGFLVSFLLLLADPLAPLLLLPVSVSPGTSIEYRSSSLLSSMMIPFYTNIFCSYLICLAFYLFFFFLLFFLFPESPPLSFSLTY